ncbi:MAG TPA: MYXO-CTERM sorting domain-containing protein, partial [Polyangia bacterium]|nr:MYXO-CTERM sorting domain-containing protein [Polyangia bacterium]
TGGTGSGGTSSAGGGAGTGGHAGATPGSGGGAPRADGASGGCSCRTGTNGAAPRGAVLSLLLIAGAIAWSRRRRAVAAQTRRAP